MSCHVYIAMVAMLLGLGVGHPVDAQQLPSPAVAPAVGDASAPAGAATPGGAATPSNAATPSGAVASSGSGVSGDAPSPATSAPVQLESVVVTATRSPAAWLGSPASVSIVDEADLERRDPVRLGDALADLPGVYVRGAAMGVTFPSTGQAVLSLRGIPRTPRTLVMIDGQPVNNALSGGVNVAAIPFGSVERIEVVRGPYSALYGGAAMGGVVNAITASPDDPLTEVRGGAGNLQQYGAQIVHRRRYEGGLGVVLSATWRESAGDPYSDYVIKVPAPGADGTWVEGARPTRDPSGAPRYWIGTQGARPWSQLTAQLSLHFSPTPTTSLVGGLGWADYSVGYSRPESYLRDAGGNPVFSGPVRFSDGGVVQRLSLAQTDWLTSTPSGERDRRAFLRAQHRFGDGSVLRAQLATLRHDFYFGQPTPGAASYDDGTGTLLDQPNRRIDADLSLRKPMAPAWALTGGVSLNRSTLDRSNVALRNWRDHDSRAALLNTDSGTSGNAALYVQSEHELRPGLTAYVGGRYDWFETDGQVTQYTAPPFEQRYDRRSFDQFSPKLAVVWEPQPWLSLRASYGQGFRPPALLDLYGRTVARLGPRTLVTEPAPDLVPERVQAVELGADVALDGGARGSLAVYAQRLEDLIYRRTLASTATMTLTRNENVGAADIDGVEGSVRWPTPLRGLAFVASATYLFRYQVSRNDRVPEMVGKNLTDVPQVSGSVSLEYDAGRWSGLLAVRHVGHVFGSGDDLNVNSTQGVFGSYDAYTIASARVAWRPAPQWGVSLAVDNLTDREYFVFYRQPGRTAYGEVSYRF